MNVIEGGLDALNAILYKNNSIMNTDFFREQWTNIPNSLSDIGTRLMEIGKQTYNNYMSNNSIEIARRAVELSNVDSRNYVANLQSLDQFRLATESMQRWLMTCPGIKQRHINQTIDGYSDNYVRPNDDIGENDYNYRLATSGLCKLDAENNYSATTYSEKLLTGDRELSASEVIDIAAMWRQMEIYLDNNKDPTDIFGN
jgi:hypothetical protein